MKRYRFLKKDDVYEALNKLRAAFLAAKDGHQVEEIINGILTNDERLKIGRRVIIAQLLEIGETYRSISNLLKVGKQTIIQVQNSKERHPICFDLINKREEKVESEYRRKAYRKTGGPKLVFKKKKYTGFTRKDVSR